MKVLTLPYMRGAAIRRHRPGSDVLRLPTQTFHNICAVSGVFDLIMSASNSMADAGVVLHDPDGWKAWSWGSCRRDR